MSSFQTETPIDCRWAPPAGDLQTLREVPARAACSVCFVEATINVSVRAPRAGQAQPLALRALERELRAQGCAHTMPKEIAGRRALPKEWFP